MSKAFPEEAMPDIIRLIHANSNSKVFLTKEFGEFWRRKTSREEEGSAALVTAESGGQDTPTTNSGSGHQISKRKIVDKIQVGRLGSEPPYFGGSGYCCCKSKNCKN